MKRALLLASFSSLVWAYACGADPLYLDETDTVVTVQPEGARYGDYETYYLPERIVELCLQPTSGTPSSAAIGGAAGGPSIDPSSCGAINHDSDSAILEAVAQNLDDMGYDRVDEADRDDADIAILVGAVSRYEWSLQRPYCYPTNFYGGCVDQSENPDITVPYRSLVIQMIDVQASENDVLSSAWTAGIQPLVQMDSAVQASQGGAPTGTRSSVWQSAIDQAFVQSPYLADGGTN